MLNDGNDTFNLLTKCHFSVIHTDVFARGVLMPTGHLDFYANGGFDQPGCYHQLAMSPGSCNHERAPAYYAESINSEIGFWGFRCGKNNNSRFESKSCCEI